MDGSTRGGGGIRGGGEPPAVSAAMSCEGCAGAEGDGRVDQELLEGFGVSVCRTCKVGLLLVFSCCGFVSYEAGFPAQ